ncbi:LAQU0S19e00650g1_1 [Lachancea quebecensis]|uniref:LAQU0S19e00650g1_1 n=1 Tax=Lachancea quebecensis TaxID=1654605 RepID=A0A0P1KXC9_9SACH|nr:LAQU0S19e00650g1_1 [Lachancea quebecensis]
MASTDELPRLESADATETAASFLGIESDELSAVGSAVIANIAAKAGEFQQLQADNLRTSVTVDELRSSSERKLGACKDQVHVLLQELESLRSESAQFEKLRLELTSEKQRALNDSETLRLRNEALEQQKQALESSKNDVVCLLNEKISDLSSFKQEADDLLQENRRLRQQTLHLESENRASKSEDLQRKAELHRLSQELSLCRSNSEWQESQLAQKNAEFNAYRHTSQSQLADLTQKLETLEQELQASTRTNTSLREHNAQLTGELETQLRNVKKLTDDFNIEKQEFTREMSLKARLVDLLEGQVQSLKSNLELRSVAGEHDEGSFSDPLNAVSEELAQKTQQLEESELKIQKLEQTVQDLISTDKNNHANPSALEHRTSVTDLYGDISMLKRQVIHEKRQKEHLQNQVEAFVVELESKVPMLSSFKDRNDMLEEQLAETAYMLESTSKDKENVTLDLRRTQAQIHDFEVQISELTRQRSDLARQVQFLLIQTSVRSDSKGPLTTEETAFVKRLLEQGNLSFERDTQKVISERLVEFRDIVELQSKNADLLCTIRNLADKLESEEEQSKIRSKSLENDAIRDAKEAILTLQEHAQELESRIEVLTKERDAYKAIQSSAGRGSKASEESLVSSKGNINARVDELERSLAIERGEAEKNMKMLNSEIQDLLKQKTKLAIEVEKERTSKCLAEERLKVSQGSLKLTKQENEELNKRYHIIQENLLKQDTKTQETLSSLVESQSKVATLEAELKSSIARIESLRSSQKQKAESNEQLTAERNNLMILVTQLQTLQGERDTLLEDTEKGYKEKVQSLEVEVSQLRLQLSKKSDEFNDFVTTSDSRSRWYQEKIDSLNETLKDVSSQVASQTQATRNLESQKKLLEGRLKEAETRAQSYDVLNQTDDVLAQTETLRMELEKSKIKLQDAYSQIEEQRGSCKSTEEALSAVTTAFERFKHEHSKDLGDMKKKEGELVSQVEALEHQLSNLNNELGHQKKQFDSEKVELENQIVSLHSSQSAVDSMKGHYEAQLGKLTQDLNQQAAFANKAQENYEQELQKHADVSKTISQLREESQKYKNQVSTLHSSIKQLEKIVDESDGKWLSQKEDYEAQLRSSNQRIEDLAVQNGLLLDQLDLEVKHSDVELGQDEPQGKVRELITSLRRERDILQTKLEVSKRSETVLHQKLESIEQELSYTREELSKLQALSGQNSITAEEHNKLLEQLNQLNLLRESNITLRSEVQKKSQRCQELEGQVNDLQQSLQPLESELASLKRSVKAKDSQISLISEETNRWKQRSQDILSKFERIDPEEHKKLGEELSQAKAELATKADQNSELEDRFQRLKKQARERLDAAKAVQNSLSAELAQAREAQSNVENQLKKEQDANKTLQESLRKLESEANIESSTQPELESVLQKLSQAEKKARDIENGRAESEKALQSELEKIKIHAEELEGRLNEAQVEIKSLEEAKREAVIDNSELEKVKKDLEEHNNKLIAEKEAEIRNHYEELRVQERAAFEKELEEKEKHIPADIEILKRQWEEDYEQKTIKRIEESNEILRKRIRLPTEEKINKIVEARKSELEQEFESKLQKRVSEIASQTPQPASFTEVMKRHKQEIEKLKTELKKEMDDEMVQVRKKAFDEGKQQASMKSTFLEKKVAKLEAQVKANGSGTAPSASSPNKNTHIEKPNRILEASPLEDAVYRNDSHIESLPIKKISLPNLAPESQQSQPEAVQHGQLQATKTQPTEEDTAQNGLTPTKRTNEIGNDSPSKRTKSDQD